MSDSQEKSDDLIAELAKLMASNASGADSSAKPTVIKLPPLNEATVQATPVRIPGMEPARTEQPRPAAIAPVRIPGMEKPAGISDLPPAPKPAAQFDFGRPPAASPVIQTEPLSNWENREVPKVALSESNPRPATVTQLASMKFDAPSSNGAATARVEPKAMPAPPPAQASAVPLSSKPSTAPDGDGFNFDFGFGTGSNGGAKQPPTAANDPIADLIAAELLDEPDEPIPVAPRSVDTPAPISVRPVAATSRGPTTAVPVKPVSVSPRAVESDRFNTAPVFGGKAATAPAAPIPHISTARAAELDPMEEIENLIGEAVRVEMTPAEKSPAVAPVPPPLNTSFAAPRRAAKDEPRVESAEAAILAAAAASGSTVDRVEAPASDDRPYKRMKVKPPKTRGVSSGARQYVGIAVAGTLLLAAGFGLYWVLGMGRDNPADAPVLTADTTPAKVEPAVTANLTVDEQQPSGSAVFNEIDGTSTAEADSEALVSRDETEGETVAEVARVVEPVAPTDEISESGLANRKVRTVTVRPDGTIVSGDDAVAGASLLPVERPDVPEIPGTEPLTTAATETSTDATETGATEADPLSALVSETAPLEEPAPLEVATAEPVPDTPAVFDGSLQAPIPMPRPFDRSGLVGAGLTRAAAVDLDPQPQDIGVNEPASTPLSAFTEEQTTAVAEEPAPAATGGSGAYVQLSSQNSESGAQSSLRETQSRMAGLLNGVPLEIRAVNLGARGTWYRVVLPTGSFREATQTCASLKANGIDCVAIGG
jgi:hypothetical protein